MICSDSWWWAGGHVDKRSVQGSVVVLLTCGVNNTAFSAFFIDITFWACNFRPSYPHFIANGRNVDNFVQCCIQKHEEDVCVWSGVEENCASGVDISSHHARVRDYPPTVPATPILLVGSSASTVALV